MKKSKPYFGWKIVCFTNGKIIKYIATKRFGKELVELYSTNRAGIKGEIDSYMMDYAQYN